MSSLPPTLPPALRPTAGGAARRTGVVAATAAVALGLALTPGTAGAAPLAPAAPIDAPRGAIAVVDGSTHLAVPPQVVERLREHGLRLVRVDGQGQTREAAPAGSQLQLDVTSGVITNLDGRIGGRVLYQDRGLAVVNTKTRQVARLAEFESDLTRNAVLGSVNDAQSFAVGYARSELISRQTLNVEERQVKLDSRVRLTERAAAQLNQAAGTKAFTRGAVFAKVDSTFNLDEEQDVRAALGLDRDLKSTDKAQTYRQQPKADKPGRAQDELATEANLKKAFPKAVG
ncbi:hypothetical protein AAHZ94_22375 [Streptomyces sp. HSW2009]|uniref:hypothetical protein n=1 Tax=Streptomyces sp. HSW2009 TaxID=3142890 RepID=UPI0032EC5B92